LGWLCDHHLEILDGYTAALDRIHLITEDSAVARANVRLQDSIDIASKELEAALDEVDRLRGALGEQALVIEQQDREMERMRAGLTEIRDNLINAGYEYHGESSSCPEVQLVVIERLLTIQGAPCTDATKTK
jgi:hypothetical protein